MNKGLESFEILENTPENLEVVGRHLLYNLEDIEDLSRMPELADYLLTLKGVHSVLVYGIKEEAVYILSMSKNGDALGRQLRDAFDGIGVVKGCGRIVLAKFPLGLISLMKDKSIVLEIIKKRLSEKFSKIWRKGKVMPGRVMVAE